MRKYYHETSLKETLRWAVKFSSVLYGLGMVCIIALTWFAAFHNNDWITVRINRFGERDAELIMWVLLGPVFTSGLLITAYELWLERRNSLRRQNL